jgi:trans-aconitate 2-methyltransferase
VVEWVKGTALRPLLAALGSEADREAFLAEYAERLRPVYPPRALGTVLPFRRIFAVAHRMLL